MSVTVKRVNWQASIEWWHKVTLFMKKRKAATDIRLEKLTYVSSQRCFEVVITMMMSELASCYVLKQGCLD